MADSKTPLHPQQFNVHPLATGISYGQWIVQSIAQQPHNHLWSPSYIEAWHKQKWTQSVK